LLFVSPPTVFSSSMYHSLSSLTSLHTLSACAPVPRTHLSCACVVSCRVCVLVRVRVRATIGPMFLLPPPL
jgi:hypothetical protein